MISGDGRKRWESNDRNQMMETKETIAKPPNPVNVTPPIAASLLSGMDVVFVEALVSTAGAAVEVIVPP